MARENTDQTELHSLLYIVAYAYRRAGTPAPAWVREELMAMSAPTERPYIAVGSRVKVYVDDVMWEDGLLMERRDGNLTLLQAALIFRDSDEVPWAGRTTTTSEPTASSSRD